MSLKLYAFDGSPPCRAVQILLDILNIKHTYVETHPLTGATRTPEFLKLNPLHTVPVLQDGALVIAESRPILTYLADAYAANDDLYPKDAKTRAKVDMRLFFDMGTFFEAHFATASPVLFGGASSPPKDKVDRLIEVLKWVSNMVRGGYCAGTKTMTVADVAFMATYSTVRACAIVDVTAFHFIEAWYNRCKQQVPHFEKACGKGANELAAFYRAKLAENRGL